MKLTWFGGTTMRVHIGGAVLVLEPEAAPAAVNRQELLSGADRVLRFGDMLPGVDAASWTPARASRALDPPRDVQVFSIGVDACLISGEGDPPLLLSNAVELPRLGRWADAAVIVAFGARGANWADAMVALDLARPRHLVLAADDGIVDRLLDRLDKIDDTLAAGLSFASLEPGLALEV